MHWLDQLFERGSRKVAQRTSRRSALIGIGRMLAGVAAVLPVLPFDRVGNHAHAAGRKAKRDDDTDCEYWRYCALDGFLCTCCGGSVNQCPPGSEASKVTWIGTCRSHLDGRDYLMVAVLARVFAEHCRKRSARWKAVHVPEKVFTGIIRPVEFFVPGSPP